MAFEKKAVDSEVFHVNTLSLHGEIRKAEVATQSWTVKETGEVKESQSIIVKIDDDNEDRIELVDRDMSHHKNYQKGKIGTFTLRLDIAKEFGSKYTAKVNIISLIVSSNL